MLQAGASDLGIPTLLNSGSAQKMKSSLPVFLALFCISLEPQLVLAAQVDSCAIEPTSKISSINQARCLLRPIFKGGKIGPVRTTLPTQLGSLLSQGSLNIDRSRFRQYLNNQGIAESEIGGSLDGSISRANDNSPQAELARYFIIHDTSTPNYLLAPFPSNIDDASWEGNNLNRWLRGEPLAHVFISRTGASVTPLDFSKPWRSTVYESKNCGIPCKGLFLGVELVQPRRSDPGGPAENDMIAPTRGFTESQLERLAVVYVSASIRRGKWLIPAFHAVLDMSVKGGHDDPQNFDLNLWDKQLTKVLQAVGSNSTLHSDFSFPAPDVSTLSKRDLWATYYHVWNANETNPGIPLLGESSRPISVTISPFDWCKGAVEGTLHIKAANGVASTYNHLDKLGPAQADCRRLLSVREDWINETSKSRFTPARGPYGDGVKNYRLVPFRTIAVDPNFIPYGSVVFIPSFRGQTFNLPDGKTVAHDGFFFAADTGRAIKQNHIDVFVGVEKANPFPTIILSKPSPTLQAYIVSGDDKKNAMERLHR